MNQTTDRAFLLRVVAAFAALYVIWGSTYFAIRITLDSMSAAASAAMRFIVAGPFLLLLARLNGYAIIPPRRDRVPLAVVGCLLLVGGNGLVVWSEQYVASGLAALTVATTPLWIAIVGAVLPRGERLPASGWDCSASASCSGPSSAAARAASSTARLRCCSPLSAGRPARCIPSA